MIANIAGILSIPTMVGFYSGALAGIWPLVPAAAPWIPFALAGLSALALTLFIWGQSRDRKLSKGKVETLTTDLQSLKNEIAKNTGGSPMSYSTFLKLMNRECRGMKHTGEVQIDGVSHIGCEFRDVIFNWRGQQFDITEDCLFYGHNEWRTTVETSRSVVTFLKLAAYVRIDAAAAAATSAGLR